MTKNDYSVCVVGLGSMGMGAARSCIAAGLTTYGTDLTPSACQSLKDAGRRRLRSGRRGLRR